MKKQHGNTGNKYGKKENPKSAYLHIRVTPELKKRLTAHAEKSGMDVTEMVTVALENILG